MSSDCLQAENAALRLIARAEQNVSGLTRKLEKKGFNADCVQTVVAKLCEAGLVDDRRYARLWLESRISCHASSPLRLFSSLLARNINRHDADFALKETLDDEAEFQLLHRFVHKLERKRERKKHGDVGDTVQSLKYLLRNEGFSSLAIERFFDEQTIN